MSRYLGPKHRLARREGKNLLEKTSNSLARRLTVPPGMHGVKGHRRPSEYGIQLREKQYAKRYYGLLERAFHKYYVIAKKVPGKTGEVMLQLLETRLDNIVYRLGFVPSRFMARQIVSHGHISVNGKRVTIPSYTVKKDDVVALNPKAINMPTIIKCLEKDLSDKITWLERKAAVGKLLMIPTRDQIPFEVNEQLVVEYYSR